MQGRRFTRTARALALAAGLAPVLAGCGGPPRPPAGYDHLRDDLAAVNAGPLAGRRIVLDPGHGGFFRGALGVRGLTEAEVNLGVAVELAGLLRAQGASVLLTRETDRDYLTPADSSLKADLAERVRQANAIHPDLFVSIHHNADPNGSHGVNETRVYFQLGDDGPSLEAAEDVHRFLARNLGISPSRVVAGNYAVLRGVDCPALLTESSYITYPPTEKKLARDAARRLEAQALDLGIAAFFARRSPVLEEFRAWAPGIPPSDTLAAASLEALRARVRGAFDAVDMRLDGAPVAPVREGQELEWRPPAPMAPGPHDATLRVRLAGEGSSRLARVHLVITGAPAEIVAEFPDQPAWDGTQPLGLRVRVHDRAGQEILDSLRLKVHDDRTGLVSPAETTLTLRDGAAWAYFRRPPGSSREANARVRLTVNLDPPMSGGHGTPWVPAARPGLPLRPAGVPVRTGFALEMPAGVPLRDAPGTREPDPALGWINRDGFVRLPEDTVAGPDTRGARAPELRGYRPWAGDSLWPPRFVAIAGGALRGRRIVLDPAGGGDDDGGHGASGARGSALNLEVARSLAAMLTAAGAEVKLTREGDAPLSDRERVRISEAFRADRYLRIAHPAAPPRLGTYFSSAAGRRWAERAAGIAASLGLPLPAIGDDAEYPIQQTSCTALDAALGRVDDPDPGGIAPARLRLESYGLYLGLAREWAPDAAWPLDTLEVLGGDGRAVPGAAVRLGEALILESDPLGRVVFARTEAGPMLVEVQDSRAPMRRILLDSDHAIRLSGRTDR
jgi:N-acetylmuramoyl-L-alanine amidase